ncbi:MAG: RNA-binding domain-containing protein [Clostridia bacterium]
MEEMVVSPARFYGCDFHVHTPKSTCFETSEEKGYFDLLQKCKANGVEVVAITDHNSVEGYSRLMAIRRELECTRRTLEGNLGGSQSTTAVLRQVDEFLALFERILILPGVEYEARPGIHLLCVFDPQAKEEDLRKFLAEGGYPPEEQGKEEPTVVPAWDVLDAIHETSNLGGIVIAAHADSDKGIYNDLKTGYRASVFRASELYAVACNSALTADKIRSLLRNKPYKRTHPLAIIQCSDYHGKTNEAPGRPLTYLKLSRPCFQDIKTALRHPDEDVSPTETPEDAKIIARLSKDPANEVVQNPESEHGKARFVRALCSFANSGPGTIVVGVTENSHRNVLGVDTRPDDFAKMVRSFLLEVSPPPTVAGFSVYRLHGTKFIYAVRVRQGSLPVHIVKESGLCYIRQAGETILAGPSDVARLVEDRFMIDLKRITDMQNAKRKSLLRQLEALGDGGDLARRALKFRRASLPLAHITGITEVPPPSAQVVIDARNLNLLRRGNVAVLRPDAPRLPYAYLRCSVPKMYLQDPGALGVPPRRGACILVCPRGAMYLADESLSEEWWAVVLASNYEPAWALTISDRYRPVMDEKVLLAYLKSSPCLWYELALYNSAKLGDPLVLGSIPVPVEALGRIAGEIRERVERILGYEYEFLEKEAALAPEERGTRRDSDMVNTHNGRVAVPAAEIDAMIFRLLDLDEEDVEQMLQAISANDLFVPRVPHGPSTDVVASVAAAGETSGEAESPQGS